MVVSLKLFPCFPTTNTPSPHRINRGGPPSDEALALLRQEMFFKKFSFFKVAISLKLFHAFLLLTRRLPNRMNRGGPPSNEALASLRQEIPELRSRLASRTSLRQEIFFKKVPFFRVVVSL